MHSITSISNGFWGLFSIFGGIVIILKGIFEPKISFELRFFGIIIGVGFLILGCLLLHQIDPSFLPFLDKLPIPHL